ncbi:crotonase/enoyl-CoA hydratase family protein [Maricurvus nonylphenolicus]|uniref:crotonase/enoyl-CoA hydratase family protein n=1 Tax=Maricurvus nonylphenolicus TaxID=1008307 RepID=UPI0036F21D77
MTAQQEIKEIASDDVIQYDIVSDHVVVIRINRPKQKNAFDSATAKALEKAIDNYEADNNLRCAILTGSSDVFSAGQDLIAASQGDMAVAPKRGPFGIMQKPPEKPIIAAIEGPALAGGMELSLSCDLAVASRASIFGLPEASRALLAIGGGLFRLSKRIPYHLAMEMALTGKPWSAEKMAELGLVNRVTEPGEALAGAIELANTISAAGPLAIKASKAIIQQSSTWSDKEAWDKQMVIAKPVLESEDVLEGLKAFAEKRMPVWQGK